MHRRIRSVEASDWDEITSFCLGGVLLSFGEEEDANTVEACGSVAAADAGVRTILVTRVLVVVVVVKTVKVLLCKDGRRTMFRNTDNALKH